MSSFKEKWKDGLNFFKEGNWREAPTIFNLFEKTLRPEKACYETKCPLNERRDPQTSLQTFTLSITSNVGEV